jgi:Transmembrane secretion effector
MALGAVIWGSAASIVGAGHTLFGAAALFLASLLLARRLSLNSTGNLEQKPSGDISIRVETKELSKQFTPELLAA